uniref:Uncharacterized protein n=1 Tax=Caenorhabditis japonica TaxID=281687 RepID=A0A8R1EQW0_CAEJA
MSALREDPLIAPLTDSELRLLGLAPSKRREAVTPQTGRTGAVYRCNPMRAYDAYQCEMDAFNRFHQLSQNERDSAIDLELEELSHALDYRIEDTNSSPEEMSDDEEWLEDWNRGWAEEVTNSIDTIFHSSRKTCKPIKKPAPASSKVKKNSVEKKPSKVIAPAKKEKATIKKKTFKLKKETVSTSNVPQHPICRSSRKCAHDANKKIHKNLKFWV